MDQKQEMPNPSSQRCGQPKKNKLRANLIGLSITFAPDTAVAATIFHPATAKPREATVSLSTLTAKTDSTAIQATPYHHHVSRKTTSVVKTSRSRVRWAFPVDRWSSHAAALTPPITPQQLTSIK